MYIGVCIEIRDYFTKCLSRSCGSDYTTSLLTYSVIIVCFLEDFPRKTLANENKFVLRLFTPSSLLYITHMPSYYHYNVQKHGIE